MFLFSKTKVLIFSLLFIASLFLLVAPVALAISTNSTGLDTTANVGFGVDTVKANSDLPTIIGRVVGTGLAFLGVVFFVLILYAGLTWILSMGKEEKINQAKEMITAAVLGLIVVLGAYAITTLIPIIFTEAVPSVQQPAK